MKKILFGITAAALLATSFGCNSCGSSCNRGLFDWFNRGDSCSTCSSDAMSEEPGLLGTPIYSNVPSAPRSSGVLPGPIGISPIESN